MHINGGNLKSLTKKFLEIEQKKSAHSADFFLLEYIIDESNDKDKQQEITEDLISIIHHYSMKIYSNRKRKKIEQLIKDNDNN